MISYFMNNYTGFHSQIYVICKNVANQGFRSGGYMRWFVKNRKKGTAL